MGIEGLRLQSKVAQALSSSEGRGPPADVAPGELLRKLIATEPPSEVCDFPRAGADGAPVLQYRMRVLTQYEVDGACANAEQYARRLLKDKSGMGHAEIREMRAEAWEEIYNNARLVELLYAACRDKEDASIRLFATPDDLRRLLTADELASLFNTYVTVQYRYGPLWRTLTDEEVEAWLARLESGVGAYPLSQLEPGQLVQLVTSLAEHLRSSRTDSGSPGSPSADGSSDTSQPAGE
jgi:hypothetical protein